MILAACGRRILFMIKRKTIMFCTGHRHTKKTTMQKNGFTTAAPKILQIITGPYERIPAFDQSMAELDGVHYEAPTAIRLADGRWCLFLDYYGVRGSGQGYVPFVADSLASGTFTRADGQFAFPYRFKHGTVLNISMDEYERIKAHSWQEES